MGNQKSQQGIGKSFIIGSVIGSVVGASAALMFAPKSGRDLRNNINQGTMQIKNRAYDFKDTAYEKGYVWKYKAFDKGADLKNKAADSVSRISKCTRNFSKTIQNRLQGKTKEVEALEAAREVADAIEEAAKEYKKK